MHVFHIDNSGPAKARNLGIKNSTGDWIMFLDSDDALKSDICERLINAANKYSAEMAFCNLKDIDSNGDDDYIPFNGRERLFEGESKKALERMLVSLKGETQDSILCLSGPVCKIIKREILKEITFPENISSGEDACFCLEVISNAKSVVYISDILYLRYVRADSLSGIRTDMSERRVKYTNWVIDRYYSDKYFTAAVKNLVANNLFYVIYMYYGKLDSIDYGEANKYIKRYIELQRISLSIADILYSDITVKRKILLTIYSLKAHRLAYIICKIIYRYAV